MTEKGPKRDEIVESRDGLLIGLFSGFESQELRTGGFEFVKKTLKVDLAET